MQNVKEIFLQLTSNTTVPDYEGAIIGEILPHLKGGGQFDFFGNLFYQIGESRTIFTSHMDNFCESSNKVNHVFNGNYIETDRRSVLGADDKAGITIMLWMIKHQIPGTYCFFKTEETGCEGSAAFRNNQYDMLSQNLRCISFDRKGFNDIITHQNGINTCSKVFANELANQLNQFHNFEYKRSNLGGKSDSDEFKHLIPECTNISVGYFNQHTFYERQDIDFLEKLADACLKVEWEKLPVSRRIPNKNSILAMELSVFKYSERRRKEEINQIEKELGFSINAA